MKTNPLETVPFLNRSKIQNNERKCRYIKTIYFLIVAMFKLIGYTLGSGLPQQLIVLHLLQSTKEITLELMHCEFVCLLFKIFIFQVSSSSNFSETICVCSNPPGNNFATTFYVPPNTIDFGTVFQKFNLKDNAAVLATIISLIVLYLMICIWAFRQDRKDIERVSISILYLLSDIITIMSFRFVVQYK